MGRLIRKNRQALDRELGETRLRGWVSPVLLGLERRVEGPIASNVSGIVLDAGCGRGPFRSRLEAVAELYESLDQERNLEDQTWVADIQSMPDVPSERYDTVFCSEVLEHVPLPCDALAELHRVLKPGGSLILTVPFLARLHDEPHDFYRYTRNGLRHLLETAGFRIDRLERTGSVFGFLGHQVSTVLVGTTWHLPFVRWLALAANAALVTFPCHWADRIAGSDLLPLGYVVTATRKMDVDQAGSPERDRTSGGG